MLTRAALRTWLGSAAPSGVASALATALQNAAIDWAVDHAYPEYQDRTYLDIIFDGVTTRFALVGTNITVAPFGDQVQPEPPNTAGVPNPTTPPPLSQSNTASSFLAGTFTGAYNLQTAAGGTWYSPTGTVIIAAGKSVTFGAIAVPTTGAPVTSVIHYLSAQVNDARVVYAGAVTPVAGIAPAATYSALGLPPSYATTLATNFTDIAWKMARNALVVEHQTNTLAQYTDGSAVVSTVAPGPAGTQVRVWYDRRAAYPTDDVTPIRIEDLEYLRVAALVMYQRLLAGAVGPGDTDFHSQQATQMEVVLDAVRAQATRTTLGPGLQAREVY